MKFVGPWIVHKYTVHWKSQHLRLLFMQQCMNSNRIPPKTREKKKKKKKKCKTQTVKRRRAIQTIP